MSDYRAQLAEARDAVTIAGPLRYAWLGQRSRIQSPALHEALDASKRRAYLLGLLAQELYASFYCHGCVVPARWEAPRPSEQHSGLARAVGAANAGRGGHQAGWTLDRLDGEAAVVRMGKVRVRVAAADCDELTPGAPLTLPQPARVRVSAPGFLTILGDAGGRLDPPIVRLYWNLTPAGVTPLVRGLTAELNARGLAFELKLVDHPARMDRGDAAVLYVAAHDFAPLRSFLVALAERLASTLRPATPALTLALAPGLGAAEEPGGGDSFGTRRCRLLAEGILEAHEQGDRDAIFRRFARDEIDLDAPYREPGLAHVL